MIKLILLLSFIFSFNLVAQDLEECMLLGESYGNGKKKTSIPATCETIIKQNAYPAAVKEYAQEDVKVFGHKNFIFTELGPNSGLKKYQSPANLKTLVISGDVAGMEDILALDVDFKNRTTVALVIEEKTEQPAIFTYDLCVGGKLAPRRRIITSELEDATSLKINANQDKIYVLFESLGKIKTFNLLDYNTGNAINIMGNVQGSLDGPATVLAQVRDITFDGQGSIYILDSAAKKVYKFKESSFVGNISPSAERSVTGGNGRYQHIHFNSEKQLLEVTDSAGAVLNVNP